MGGRSLRGPFAQNTPIGGHQLGGADAGSKVGKIIADGSTVATAADHTDHRTSVGDLPTSSVSAPQLILQ